MTGLFAHGDIDAVAVIAGAEIWRWRDLLALAPPTALPSRRVIVGDATVGTIASIVAGLAAGDVVTLVHPRWPAAMRDAAVARAGGGRPVPSSWEVGPDGGSIVFSSGSTGVPKAIFHHTRAHVDNARGANAVMPFRREHRWLMSLPPCHVGGLAIIMRALVGVAPGDSGAIVVADAGARIADAVVATRPTHLSVVATQLRELLASAEATAVMRDASLILVGGGPLPASLAQAGLEAGVPLRQTWGLSEMGSQVCTSEAGKPQSCGRALPNRRLVVDDDGRLWVGGAPLAAGFVDGDDLVGLEGADGLYATGDVGVMADDGLVVVGRVDNQFISGGENIQPEAIEAALSDADVSVIVVAVDDDRFGKRPAAFVAGGVGSVDVDVDVDAIVARLRERAQLALPRFMHPVVWLPLPPTPGMKASRRALEAIAQERYGADSTKHARGHR